MHRHRDWLGRLSLSALSLYASLVWTALAQGASAQPSRLVVVVPAAPEQAESLSTSESGSGSGSEPRPSSTAPFDDATLAALRDALGAQLSLVETEARVISESSTALTMDERMARGLELAAEQRAIGVLWLEVRPTDHWFVYAMDDQAERVVVRPMLVRPASVSAAIEAVAIIARGTVEALQRGEPIAGESYEPSEAPAASLPMPAEPSGRPPAQTDDDALRLRLALGYVGETFADEVPWQSGLGLGVSLLAPFGLYAGIHYTLFPAHEQDGRAVFSVQRHPLAVAVGYRLDLSPLALDAELALVGDFLMRTTSRTSTEGEPADASGRLLAAACPRVRAELYPLSWLGVFIEAALPIQLNNFRYVSPIDTPSAVLTPNRMRLQAAAGLAILH